ncbi:hypothetical protein KR018_012518 [Drosophila ironensis]|nr:hypothetical protein KR018_012518 [Drosophila ironensis]
MWNRRRGNEKIPPYVEPSPAETSMKIQMKLMEMKGDFHEAYDRLNVKLQNQQNEYQESCMEFAKYKQENTKFTNQVSDIVEALKRLRSDMDESADHSQPKKSNQPEQSEKTDWQCVIN